MPRFILFSCVFISGFTALVFQMVWQKYLAQILGSEARSVSLVVAIFLFGLATGYQAWGKLTEKTWPRYQLLKIYGFIEMAIGLYAVLFPIGFDKVRQSIHLFPDVLFMDFLLTLALLFIPTFLMGASIPLLTVILPKNSGEINRIHAKIYGINTLGAFFGVVVASFYLIPKWGLFISMGVFGVCNILIGLVFGLNRLSGKTHKTKKVPTVGKGLPPSLVYLFTFVTGGTTIALEVLFVRVFSLTTGAGFWVFPIILGIFILGLGMGSLTLPKKFSMKHLHRHFLGITFFGLFLFWSIPHWPYWVHHIRIQLSDIPSASLVYFALLFLFMGVVALPLIILLGRLLPVSYSLIKKTGHNFGTICGRLYFFNTLGTVFGSVICGYLALYIFQLDTVIRLVFIGTILVFILVAFCSKGFKSCAFLIMGLLIFIIFPKWDRRSHHLGLFRNRYPNKNYTFKGFLKIPKISSDSSEILHFEDGPNTTVTVIGHKQSENFKNKLDSSRKTPKTPLVKERTESMSQAPFSGKVPSSGGSEESNSVNPPTQIRNSLPDGSKKNLSSASFVVNGKSDGNTLGDFPTAAGSALIPYLFASKTQFLKALVVGMGTGITSSQLSNFEDMESVKTLEISTSALKSAFFLDPYNGELTKKSKHTFVKGDAFRYFQRFENKVDIIISEPSNPWVAGVENLYTKDFYQLVSKQLNKKGIFFQWLQGYAFSNKSFNLILQNLVNSFKDYRIYKLNGGDFGLLASPSELAKAPLSSRLNQTAITELLSKLGCRSEELPLLQVMDKKLIQLASLKATGKQHTLDTPRLHFLAGLDFYKNQMIDPIRSVDIEFLRHFDTPGIKTLLANSLKGSKENCSSRKIVKPFLCHLIKSKKKQYKDLIKKQKTSTNLRESVSAYHRLRQNAWISPDIDFLRKASNRVKFLDKNNALDLIPLLVQQLVFEGFSKEALNGLETYAKEGLITDKQRDFFIKKTKKSSSLLNLLNDFKEKQSL